MTFRTKTVGLLVRFNYCKLQKRSRGRDTRKPKEIKYTKNHIEILDVLNLHWNIECHCREYTKNHTEILHVLNLQWTIETTLKFYMS